MIISFVVKNLLYTYCYFSFTDMIVVFIIVFIVFFILELLRWPQVCSQLPANL